MRRRPIRSASGSATSPIEYDAAAIDQKELSADGTLGIEVDVYNRGERDARERVQLYVGATDSDIERAPRELRGFRSIEIPAVDSVSR